mmetsp:Transcript_85146/g.237645  ORF Transcript_85146/g.237645 Transcript_85146/m.237645 type:complete len:224 (-) Transcript_85146:18-689(-)
MSKPGWTSCVRLSTLSTPMLAPTLISRSMVGLGVPRQLSAQCRSRSARPFMPWPMQNTCNSSLRCSTSAQSSDTVKKHHSSSRCVSAASLPEYSNLANTLSAPPTAPATYKAAKRRASEATSLHAPHTRAACQRSKTCRKSSAEESTVSGRTPWDRHHFGGAACQRCCKRDDTSCGRPKGAGSRSANDKCTGTPGAWNQPGRCWAMVRASGAMRRRCRLVLAT